MRRRGAFHPTHSTAPPLLYVHPRGFSVKSVPKLRIRVIEEWRTSTLIDLWIARWRMYELIEGRGNIPPLYLPTWSHLEPPYSHQPLINRPVQPPHTLTLASTSPSPHLFLELSTSTLFHPTPPLFFQTRLSSHTKQPPCLPPRRLSPSTPRTCS